MTPIITLPRVSDGQRQALCQRLERAAALYEMRAQTKGGTASQHLRDWAEDCRQYRDGFLQGDDLCFALNRHFAAQKCDWIESCMIGERKRELAA